jgi:hypothetical protein
MCFSLVCANRRPFTHFTSPNFSLVAVFPALHCIQSEDGRLAQAVKTNGTTDWMAIASIVGTRDAKACCMFIPPLFSACHSCQSL